MHDAFVFLTRVRKNLPSGHPLPGSPTRDCQKSPSLLRFRNGTALAGYRSLGRAARRSLMEFSHAACTGCCVRRVGRADIAGFAEAILAGDCRLGPTTATPFDITGSASSAPMSGFAGASKGSLSPATMSALLAAQGQSSGPASMPIGQSDALKDLISPADGPDDVNQMSSALTGHRVHRQSNRASGISASAASTYNAIEQASQRDAQVLSASLGSPLSVRA